MNTYIFSRRFYNRYATCRYVSDFDACMFLKGENPSEFWRMFQKVMNSCPLFRTLTPNGMMELARNNRKAANGLFSSILRCVCEQYEYEYEYYMSHRYN